MKTILLIALGVTACAVIYLYPYLDRVVIIGNKALFLQVRDSQQEWTQGLSGRSSLCSYCGMLFSFPESSEHGFWMKDMYFSIDIGWLQGGSIVHLEENVSHLTPERVYRPPFDVDMVLELPAGEFTRRSIGVGDYLDL